MQIIGLTGGVASGKTAVAQILIDNGIPVIDLDQIGRDLRDRPEVTSEIARLCGEPLPSGKLDTLKIREAIFSDPAKRQAVEQYLHPLIWQEFVRRASEAETRGAKLVICEAALLVESGLHKNLDGLVVVSAPEDMRKRRVMERDHISAVLAEKIFRAQVTDGVRSRSATVVIENNGSLGELQLRVHDLIHSWKKDGRL